MIKKRFEFCFVTNTSQPRRSIAIAEGPTKPPKLYKNEKKIRKTNILQLR